jgi:hypothetical protein
MHAAEHNARRLAVITARGDGLANGDAGATARASPTRDVLACAH